MSRQCGRMGDGGIDTGAGRGAGSSHSSYTFFFKPELIPGARGGGSNLLQDKEFCPSELTVMCTFVHCLAV